MIINTFSMNNKNPKRGDVFLATGLGYPIEQLIICEKRINETSFEAKPYNYLRFIFYKLTP